MIETDFQSEAKQLLIKAKEAGILSTSFLFLGPSGVGKLSTAKWFARLINCEESAGPCGNCSACKKIIKGSHPDLTIIAPEGEYLKIDQFRKMIREIIYKPYEAKYKVFIIQSAHKMQDAAANSILKAIEEVPENSVIILTATSSSGLLDTITSRCQKIGFKLIPKNKIIEILKKNNIACERAEIAASCSNGNLKMALLLGGDEAFWNLRKKIHEVAASLPSLSLYDALLEAGNLEKKFKTKINDVLMFFLSWFKDLMIIKTGKAYNLIENIDKTNELNGASEKYSAMGIKNSLDILIQTRKLYKSNANLSLLMTNMLVDLTRLATIKKAGKTYES